MKNSWRDLNLDPDVFSLAYGIGHLRALIHGDRFIAYANCTKRNNECKHTDENPHADSFENARYSDILITYHCHSV